MSCQTRVKETPRLEAVIPWFYLKGVSTNDFDDALQALFGESVKWLLSSTISRLQLGWETEYAEWMSREWQSLTANLNPSSKQLRDKSCRSNQKGEPRPNRVADKPPDVIFTPLQTGSLLHVMFVSQMG